METRHQIVFVTLWIFLFSKGMFERDDYIYTRQNKLRVACMLRALV